MPEKRRGATSFMGDGADGVAPGAACPHEQRRRRRVADVQRRLAEGNEPLVVHPGHRHVPAILADADDLDARLSADDDALADCIRRPPHNCSARPALTTITGLPPAASFTNARPRTIRVPTVRK